jgi:hypothetical protein
MSRSMDSIATNDNLAVTGAKLEEQNKYIQHSDMPKVGESIKKHVRPKKNSTSGRGPIRIRC